MWGAILSAVSSLVSSYIAKENTDSTNETNIELADENRAWMERMSNTAYQRSRADMEKAGINPILMATKGGASTPSAQVAHIENSAPIISAAGPQMVNAAITAQTAQQNIKTSRSQEEVNNAERARLEEERKRIDEQRRQLELENEKKKAELPVQKLKAQNEVVDEVTRKSRPSWIKGLGRNIRDTFDTINPLKGWKF